MTEVIESCIADDQKRDRLCPERRPEGFTPEAPLFTSRFPKTIKDLTMAIIGIQYKSADLNDGKAMETLTSFTNSTKVPESARPTLQEAAHVTDNRGYYNIALLVYWPGKQPFDVWADKSGFTKWWSELDPENQPNGWFLEVFFPTIDRWETILTDTTMLEGASHFRSGASGPVLEHGYWGSMRDRMPIAQVDSLDGVKAKLLPGGPQRPETLTSRVRLPGRPNLAVIRSGQDWLEATEKERKLYLEMMRPALVEGMDFLRDHGEEVGCISMRFMDLCGLKGEGGKDRSFGLGFFDDLDSLEGWSKAHPTHLKIFGVFNKYIDEMRGNLSLKLYHEVCALEPEQQLFEYIACHSNTGLLASVLV